MRNILNYGLYSFLNESTISFDWSDVEVLDDNYTTNEKLHFIHTNHANIYRYNINDINTKQEIEDFISLAFPIMIQYLNSYNREKTTFTIQSKNFPYILRLELAPNMEVGNSLSVVGDLYDYDRISKTKEDEHFSHLSYASRGEIIIKDFTTKKVMRINPGDYIFKIITVSRKENFIPYSKDIAVNLDTALVEMGMELH